MGDIGLGPLREITSLRRPEAAYSRLQRTTVRAEGRPRCTNVEHFSWLFCLEATTENQAIGKVLPICFVSGAVSRDGALVNFGSFASGRSVPIFADRSVEKAPFTRGGATLL